MKLLLYCTKGNPDLCSVAKEIWWWNDGVFEPFADKSGFQVFYDKKSFKTHCEEVKASDRLNGKILAECDCEKVEWFIMQYRDNCILKYDRIKSEEWKTNWFKTMITGGDNGEKISNCYLLKESCLSFDELGDYVCPNGENNEFYALHLSNLKVFNIPKKINYYGLEKAPMNMCFKRHPVPYDNELGGWEIDRETIIISVHPEHLCKILNGEKTIEVRKQILKELKREISE